MQIDRLQTIHLFSEIISIENFNWHRQLLWLPFHSSKHLKSSQGNAVCLSSPSLPHSLPFSYSPSVAIAGLPALCKEGRQAPALRSLHLPNCLSSCYLQDSLLISFRSLFKCPFPVKPSLPDVLNIVPASHRTLYPHSLCLFIPIMLCHFLK